MLFPNDKPNHATGPGAVVWSAGRRCPGGAGTRVATVSSAEQPGPPSPLRASTHSSLAVLGPLNAATGPHGQIVLAGTGSETAGLLVQGMAGGSFTTIVRAPRRPRSTAMTTAYLGDVALATAVEEGSKRQVRLQIERYFAHDFGSAKSVPTTGAGPIDALTVAMDFRTDALLAWSQNGKIYARDMPASGVHHPLQRIAEAGSEPRIATLLSDDNRGMLMWIEQRGNRSSVYLDYSASGVRFGRPKLLERFTDPDGMAPPAGGLQLIRLSSESVMAAWAGAAGGHWVLRTAPIDQRGLQQISTISNPDGDALLSALAPGPKGEAVVLWTEPQASAGIPDPGRQTLLGARGIDAAPGRTIFGQPELITGPGPVSRVTLALDPATDRTLAVWQGRSGSIDYSIRSEFLPG